MGAILSILNRIFSNKRTSSRNIAIIPEAFEPEVKVDDFFWEQISAARPKNVLEVGTLQSVPGRSTHCMSRFPHIEPQNYVRLDVIDGADVDVVGDLHALPDDWTGRFDCVIANAVFEHLDRPWIAAKEVSRILAPGGRFLVMTHQTFPIHAYPSDFFRFSKHALRLIFEDAGLIVDGCDYAHRCLIVPPDVVVPDQVVEGWNKQFPAYILVGATGTKPA
jgi:SAM-dependent methyltransferase